ncbi:maltodextrin utilization protein YvdJ [Anoxybacillus tepidamans]|uniref:Maltodextrin utilization protein YvdJ n=1 Tax=Anoxybacteroides tepidamans TaxID=265948 RepID=A0A7W8IQA9_9BACL|nr:hypothetical protein [Anoxybacillus tepidamans]MBB5324016.1 maltodextrin utilization protein YvdJ [Anoxybacillus tepidamans]
MKRLLLLFFAVFLAACTMNPTDSQYHAQSEDRHGKNLMTANEARPSYDRIYNHFADPEKTNQNPNFISLTDGSANDRALVQKAVQVVEQYKNYRAGSVWMNGNDMWVTVHAPRDRSYQQRQKDQTRLYELLTKAIPTYDIHVRLD